MSAENHLKFTDSEWDQLIQLRNHFLLEIGQIKNQYWTSPQLLELYHRTFAERIGWKWEAVLNELKKKEAIQLPKQYVLLDFGCGTGIASSKFIEIMGPQLISELWLWDRSKNAVRFATEKLKTKNPDILVKDLQQLEAPKRDWILVLSHVINETSDKDLEVILALAGEAQYVIWIEPGTREHSSRLVDVREKLKGIMNVIAPCTHSEACGMLAKENNRHWCHFFAPPPTEVFQSAFWNQFSKKMEIDLRSLPLSYLVFSRVPQLNKMGHEMSRVIGRPRLYKGYGKFLLCNRKGVFDSQVLERGNKNLFKEYKTTVFTKEIEML
ncbi:MAG: methyltransferase domain-containing protein [Proteobacteria bacterium]|nr:methyltransferase domain-containing protein [Pseudomonadota bacterium]